jgi:uncharacterized protein YegL
MPIELPGGKIAHRPLHFFWIVDCSGSMYGEKIGTLNYAIQDAIQPMRDAANANPGAELLIRVLKFSTGAQWLNPRAEKIDDFEWIPLEANGMTDMGKAFSLLSDELRIPPMPERALQPVLVLLSDGQPTDDYEDSLNKLLSLPWGKKAIKVAISIGDDAVLEVLSKFTKSTEYVLKAGNAKDLVKMIRWVSTLPAQVSLPMGNANAGEPVVIDPNTIPEPEPDGDVW